MSARDDLNSFERDWERHLEWRAGQRNGMGKDPPGKYVAETANRLQMGTLLNLHSVPAAIEEKFRARVETCIREELDAIAMAERRRLRLLARAEAERTLNEIPADEPTPSRVQPVFEALPDPFHVDPQEPTNG